ncbi:unnamed protein product [Candida verbasci]|uniref:PLD phosphodiesterase domain-containing protein n=1 Tax=Candida verbasci TaxID=1227364 RepID=A0A9W4TWZ1_9ASCO|nr:unnamed protein product [Candida verbasci]
MASKRTRSDAFLAASNHWNKKPKPHKEEEKEAKPKDVPEVINISSDDESITEIKPKSSPIKLFYNPSYHENLKSKVNKDCIKITDIVGSPELTETYQFNFNVDLPYFLKFLDKSFINKRKPITFITGSQLLDPSFEETSEIKSKFNISEVIASLPNRYASHHTKMMINFYGDDLEVVIMSANITQIDFIGLTQMVWRSEKLKKGKTTTTRGKKFQNDLIAYLKTYKKSNITSLASILKDYDFSSVTVELIASSPGKYDIDKDEEIYGYGKLYKTLQEHDLLLNNTDKSKKYNILAQTSAISYPISIEKWSTGGILSHLICPLIFGKNNFKLLEPSGSSFKNHQHQHNYTPSIVFPTVDEVANSNVGYWSGQALHFNYTQSFIHKNYYTQNLKPYLKRWGSHQLITGREKVMPHVKIYTIDNGDNFNTLKWVYMGSHNLSKQAWGSRKGNKFTNADPREYELSSYELGVLIIPEKDEVIKPVYMKDTIDEVGVLPVRFPFRVPLTSYSNDDLPWSGKVDYGDKEDSQGMKYNLG